MSTPRLFRRNSLGHEEYAGGIDAIESSAPYGRVSNRECRLLLRLLAGATGDVPKACFSARDASASASATVSAGAGAGVSAAAGAGGAAAQFPRKAVQATSASRSASESAALSDGKLGGALSHSECERITARLLKIHGGGAFVPVSCRRVEMQKRRDMERAERNGNLRRKASVRGKIPAL